MSLGSHGSTAEVSALISCNLKVLPEKYLGECKDKYDGFKKETTFTTLVIFLIAAKNGYLQ